MNEKSDGIAPDTAQPAQPVPHTPSVAQAPRRRIAPWVIGGSVALVAILATTGILIAVNHGFDGFDDHDDRPAAVAQAVPQPAPW